jgi:hypothetical protein
MVNLHLDIIDNEIERHYQFDMDFNELVELIKTRNEDEDLVIEYGQISGFTITPGSGYNEVDVSTGSGYLCGGEVYIIPACVLDKSIVYATEDE